MTTPTTPDKTPEWMLLLEKKKNRPHRLAHEIGAGAPCLACGDKCPGLDLHFWRKVCRNCKCKKEEHDVKDDDGYAQFEILLGAGSKRKKPGAVLKIQVPDIVDNAVVASKNGVPFDWVPPNVSDDVAAEYMQQLPAAKLPISGSDGALYRRQQLERQMPLHDLDAGRCHNLTPEEIEELQKYLDNLKNNVVGQGRVTKVPTLYNEQRYTYRGPTLERNTSSSLHSSYSDQSLRSLPPLPNVYNAVPRPFLPQSNVSAGEDLPPPLPDSLPPDFENNNLKMTNSFVSNQNVSSNNASLMSSGHSKDVAHSTAVSGQLYPSSTGPYGGRSALSTDYLEGNSVHSAVAGQTGPGFSRPLNQSGGDSSAVFPHEGSIMFTQNRTNVAISTDVSGNVVPGMSRSQNSQRNYYHEDGSLVASPNPYSIADPANVSCNLNPDFSQSKDSRSISSNGFPQYGSNALSQNPHSNYYVGALSEDGRLVPSQNPHSVYNSTNIPDYLNPDFSQAGNIRGISLDALPQYGLTVPSQYPYNFATSTDIPGHLAQEFPRPLQEYAGPYQNNLTPSMGDASNANQDKLSHPAHLADAQFINENWSKNPQMSEDMRYEHSLLQYDIAGSSDIQGNSMPYSAKIIQQSKLIDNDLASQMELLSAEEHPVGSHLNCKHCSEPLVAGNVAVFADRAGESTAWHPNCFVCNTCDELLVDLIYFFSKGNVYCGRHFAELLNIPRCYACDELIFVKEYTVAEGKTFHVKHFCCYECDDPLAGKQYIPTDDQPTCLDCYQEIFGKRCHTCRKQIPAGQQRVGWKELNWHATDKCFRCHSCSKSLLGGKFVMREEQPYCDKECVLAAGK